MTGPLAQLPNFNMKLLQAFILVAEQRSFRAAASMSNRSQSAISAQVKLLEEQLGVSLFHRTTRSVELTREGEELLRGAQRALEEMTFSLRTIEETVRLDRGRVSLACAPTVAAGRLPAILAAFEQDYPTVQVSIREIPSDMLLETVRKREVDFAIGQAVPADSELQFDPLIDDAVITLAPRNLIPEDRDTITLRELATHRVLILDPITAFRQMFDREMREAGLTFRSKFDCLHTMTLIAMAEAGLGIAVLPLAVVRAAHAPSTQVLRVIEPEIHRQIAIISLRGRHLTPASERLANLIREMLPVATGSALPLSR